MKLRVAISPCPNDIFIFSGMISGAILTEKDPEFEFSFLELETLNTDAQINQWDLTKISYANFPNCEEHYFLLKSGGALGRGCGPLLLTNQKTFESAAPVMVPGIYTTANFLLDFFLNSTRQPNQNHSSLDYQKQKKIFLPFDTLYQKLLSHEAHQGVVIHEMRFTYEADGLALVQDLGEFWERQTGFPIPLGAVVLKNQYLSSGKEIESLIQRSITWAYEHPTQALSLARKYSQSLSDSVLQSHIDLYVNTFSMNIGKTGEDAVEFFFKQLRQFFPPQL